MFISDHPGLVSLTIIPRSWIYNKGELVDSLCKALTHHSETLQRIFFCYAILASIFYNEENEAKFLQSTGNLREFVLQIEEGPASFYFPNEHSVGCYLISVSHGIFIHL
jgi:hypothetical protein